MDKKTKDQIDQLQAMVETNMKQSAESSSHFSKAWYAGLVAGLQAAQLILLDDEEFSLKMMGIQDDMYQSIQNIEQLHKERGEK